MLTRILTSLFILGLSTYTGHGQEIELKAAELTDKQLSSPAFVLIGTIASNNSQALALIKTQDQKVKFYTPGDTINGFSLQSIQHNNIKLLKQNQLYTLHLQDKSSKLTVETPVDNPASHLVPKAGELHIPIERNLLKHIRQNTQLWLNSVTMRLEVTESRMSGYVIESVSNIPLDSKIGLQQGDIIKAINGIPVGQSELFARTVNSLLDASDISIQIMRDKKLFSLFFNISD